MAEGFAPVLNRLGDILLPRSLPRSSTLLPIEGLQRTSTSTLLLLMLPIEAIHSTCLLLLAAHATIVCTCRHPGLQLGRPASILSIIGLLS